MKRKIFIIIAVAIVLALLVGLIWFMFFRGGLPSPTQTGDFGTGGDRSGQTTGNTGISGNNPSQVLNPGGTTATGNTVRPGGNIGSVGTGVGSSSVSGFSNVPGVDWLGGSGGTGGPVSSFVPRTANELNQGAVSGNPTILPGSSVNNGDDALTMALLGAGIGVALCTAGFTPGVLSGGSLAVANRVTAVPVADAVTNMGATDTAIRENFLNCIARTIARAAIQQITSSVVNWINSGFNGKPSFVTNYKQFFTNVADQAAGEFIRGSALSFLCSPFGAQIRIAVAQSYARRNAASCTLSSVVNNFNSFTNGGQFNQGGWGGLLSLTNVPTNNPFGAYNYGQSALATAQVSALNQKQQDYTLGRGFLSSTREVNCRVVDGQRKCDTATVTPGSTIAESLNKTLGVGQDSLNLAKSFDEIISALITQLMVKTLQSGLSNLSGTQGYGADYLTPAQQQAQADAQALLTDMQGRVNTAQQYGSVWQGAIADIQNTQQQLQSLVNCWETASSSAEGPATREIAQKNAANTVAARDFYTPQIDSYNARITATNESIMLLQDLQTRAIGVTSAGDVASVKAAYNQALSSGAILTPEDVISAQQDRGTLQSTLALRNNQTASERQQCNEFK